MKFAPIIFFTECPNLTPPYAKFKTLNLQIPSRYAATCERERQDQHKDQNVVARFTLATLELPY